MDREGLDVLISVELRPSVWAARDRPTGTEACSGPRRQDSKHATLRVTSKVTHYGDLGCAAVIWVEASPVESHTDKQRQRAVSEAALAGVLMRQHRRAAGDHPLAG